MGNERSNCQPFITKDGRYKWRVVSRKQGAGVRKVVVGHAARLVPPVSVITGWKSRDTVCFFSLLPPSLQILPNHQAPSCHSPAPTSLNPSVCPEGLQWRRSSPEWCMGLPHSTGERVLVPTVCSIQPSNGGLFSVSWPCFSSPLNLNLCLFPSWNRNHPVMVSPLKLANLFHPADCSLSITSSERSFLLFPWVQHLWCSQSCYSCSLMTPTHPFYRMSLFSIPGPQICESKTKGCLGNHCVPNMQLTYPREPVNVEGMFQFWLSANKLDAASLESKNLVSCFFGDPHKANWCPRNTCSKEYLIMVLYLP